MSLYIYIYIYCFFAMDVTLPSFASDPMPSDAFHPLHCTPHCIAEKPDVDSNIASPKHPPRLRFNQFINHTYMDSINIRC